MQSDFEPHTRVGSGLGAISDRLGSTPSSIVAGLLAVIAAAGAAWWALRTPDPPPVESVLPLADTVSVAIPPSSTAAPEPLMVHVDGEVVRPGVHELVEGARVMDAVTAAGGLTEEADRGRVNLAARVMDGERLWVPAVGEAEPVVVAGAGGGAIASGDQSPLPIDLNEADVNRLQELPGIGPALAAAIVDHRNEAGPFTALEDLLEVPGIGPAKLEQLRDSAVV